LCVVTFDLHFRSSDIGHRLEFVLLEDFSDSLIFSVIDDGEENWSVRLLLVVGVRRSSEFPIYIITLITSRFDRKYSHHIVRSGVFNNHGVIDLRGKVDNTVIRLFE